MSTEAAFQTLPTVQRSMLFVPATRPDRIAKALASGADGVIVDCEDAVAAADKHRAREDLERFCEEHPEARLAVRVNAPDSPEHAEDLAVCQRLAGVTTLMIPKAESERALASAAALGRPLWPLIESARGLENVAELARSSGVERLSFGALDLALDLGMSAGSPGGEALLDQARFAVIVQSRLAGLIPPLAGVSPVIRDTTALRATALRASEMGFGGMLCIHPAQIAVVHDAFTPDDTQLDWARRVVTAAESSEGAFSIDGEMVDAPVIARARQLLARGKSVQHG